MGGAPGLSVWVPMRYCDREFGVRGRVWVPTVNRRVEGDGVVVSVGDAFTTSSLLVLVPMTMASASDAREIGVPDTVMAGWPGMSVWVPMRYWDAEFGVRVSVPIVIRAGPMVFADGGVVGSVRIEVDVLTMTWIWELEVWNAMIVGEGSVPIVIVEPGLRV